MATETIAKYTFFPFLRRGIANAVESESNGRGVVKNTLAFNGETAPTQEFELIGPGDILGFSRDKIIRTEPTDWNTNFAPNNLAFIEFYEEDFPWRFTPAKTPEDDKLMPWIFLMVFKDDEFTRGENLTQPTITIEKGELGESLDTWRNKQLWAWAHVQRTDQEDLANPSRDPDRIISRLVCPRRLEPNTPYTAFVLPAYDEGIEAGGGNPEVHTYPVYYEWHFHTGNDLDFEYLAGLLEPRAMPFEVGRRVIDCEQAGYGLEVPSLSKYLPLEGALRAPATAEPEENPALKEARIYLQTQIAGEVNKSLDIRPVSEEEHFPIVSPAAYGHKHVLYPQLIQPGGADKPWLHQLNANPSHRAAAGLGVKVIRKNQDKYVQRAWEQLESLENAAAVIQRTEAVMQVSKRLFEKHFLPLSDPEGIIGLAAPMLKRLKAPGGFHLDHELERNIEKTFLHRGPYRRLMRPGGVVERRKKRLDDQNKEEQARLYNPESYPKKVIISDRKTGRYLQGVSVAAANDWKRETNDAGAAELEGIVFSGKNDFLLLVKDSYAYQWVRLKPGPRELNISLVPKDTVIRGSVFNPNASALSGIQVRFEYFNDAGMAVTDARGAFQVPFASHLPGNHFSLLKFTDPMGTYQDKEIVVRFGETDIEVTLWPQSGTEGLKNKILQFGHPLRNHKLRLFNQFANTPLRGWFDDLDPNTPHLPQPIAYPYFDDPMYEKVKELGADFLIPNLHLIPNNCITLLESNRAFIEAYMAGLNVEMGRELKWREYPTDERGSYFRQFWDVKGLMADPPKDFEKYKDIMPIDQWATGALGSHNPASVERNISDPLVLAIRGGLLQAFPNTVVYAVKAVLNRDLIFLMDARSDLYVIRKRNTSSGFTEVSVFSAASNYATVIKQAVTPLQETDETFEFLLNLQGDLFAIKKRNTGSNSTEVHIISALSDPDKPYSEFIFNKGTILPETDDSFAFLLDAEENLYAVKKQNTGTNSTEVHILSRASNYQEFLLRTGTVLHPTDESFEFLLDAHNNLVAVKKRGTGSNSTEVHILSRAHDYQQYLLNTGTALPETDDSYTFLSGPNADLFAMVIGKNALEVFLLPAVGNYQSLEHKATLDIATLKLGTDTVYPIFQADIEPDIKLLGFPFNKEQAEGDGTGNGLGYFFVLKEVPGELRLGLDIDAPVDKPAGTDELTWKHIRLFDPSNIIDLSEDQRLTNIQDWGKNAAAMARIFFQKPVMIAIHAKEMLNGLKTEP